jgi:L-ascorbate metabolism protein UlaG (beta-lactamase superfamily)
VTLACGAFAQQPKSEHQPPHRILDEIRSHRSGIAVWWTGHNGWLIKADDILIGTDLCLEQEERQVPAPISAAELAGELDISFITHEHGDHFERETSKVLSERSDCMFVMPRNCMQIARDEVGIPDHRLIVAIPKQPFSLKGAQITPLRAIHGNPKFAVFEEANLEDCGYLITLGGKSFLQPGDTVLLEDHLFLKHVDVLFFSPTEHNMYIDRSVILINELEPDFIFPQHRDTFKVTPENRYWTTAYPYEVKLLLSKPLQQRYHILEMGEKIVVR